MKKQYSTMDEYLENTYKGPYSATDAIIRYRGGIVLIERKHEPHGLALPGGISERLDYHQNAVKEAKEETGLDILIDSPTWRPFYVSARPGRDPRAFISSVVYTARGTGTLAPHPDEDAKRAFVVGLPELEKLLTQNVWAFANHREVLEHYVRERSYDFA